MVKNYFKLVVALIFATNVMAQNIPSYVPKDGLVGWWPFNGNANDESGNGNNGTVNGATLTSDRNGIVNSAYSFDKTKNDFIESMDIGISGSDGRSVSFWAKTASNTVMGLINWGGNESYPNNGKRFSCVFNYQIEGITIDGADCAITYASNASNTNNEWNYFTFVMKTNSKLNEVKIYQNGILLNKINHSYYPNTQLNTLSGQKLQFGRINYPPNNFNYYEGLLDDIAIYNRALSEQEVKQLYEGCTKETATSSSFNSVIYTTNTPVNLSANPTGGTFSGEAVTNNSFNPSKAKLGKNQVKYNFKNSTGCADSTNFTIILVDTLGNKCSTYDTILKINFKLTTGIKAGQQTSMNVYPNPATDVLIIEANDIQALSGYKYKIVDLQGKEVYNALATTAKTEISLKSIGAKGMYILHIVDEKGVSIENKKIVLE